MRIVIFGIESSLGKKVAEYALETQKFQVFGFNKSNSNVSIEGVEFIEGDIYNAENIHKALRGKDVVISVFDLQEDTAKYNEAMSHIIKGMSTRGIRRILSIANPGILQHNDDTFLLEQETFNNDLKEMANKHLGVYKLLLESKLDWTLVCPLDIKSGERTKNYRVQLDYNPEGGESISLEDLADFFIQEIRNGFFMHKRVGIAY